MKIFCVIPARGGSKRIPRKNLAMCGGRPLIEWTIRAALNAGIDESGLDTYVSTDDSEIVARSYRLGAWIVARPSELAQDDTPGLDVALHAAQYGKCFGYTHLVYLQPTSPLRTSRDILIGVEMMEHYDCVVGVSKYSLVDIVHPTEWKTGYRVCGAFWGTSIDRLLRQRSMYSTIDDSMGMLEIPEERALDVDTPFDLKVADMLLREREHAKDHR